VEHHLPSETDLFELAGTPEKLDPKLHEMNKLGMLGQDGKY
jgi:hypothetical protein